MLNTTGSPELQSCFQRSQQQLKVFSSIRQTTDQALWSMLAGLTYSLLQFPPSNLFLLFFYFSFIQSNKIRLLATMMAERGHSYNIPQRNISYRQDLLQKSHYQHSKGMIGTIWYISIRSQSPRGSHFIQQYDSVKKSRNNNISSKKAK